MNVQTWPLVGWRDIVHAFRPDHSAREAHLKTLRRNHVVSDGIRFTRRANHRLAGAGHLYSHLNVSAAVLHRQDRTEDARAYRERATALEGELARVLRAYHLGADEVEPLTELASREARGAMARLSDLTEEALAGLPPVADQDVTRGLLHSADGRRVRFVDAEGTVERYLPYGLLESSGLSVGDHAVLISEFTGASLVIRLEPGLLVQSQPGLGTDAQTDPEADDAAGAESAEGGERVRAPLGDDAYRAALFDHLDTEDADGP